MYRSVAMVVQKASIAVAAVCVIAVIEIQHSHAAAPIAHESPHVLSRTSFQTRTLSHLEPLHHFEISHTDSNRPLAAFHRSHTDAYEHDTVMTHGLDQPHPQFITLSFAVLGLEQTVDMQLQEHLFEPYSGSEVWDGSNWSLVPHQLISYSWSDVDDDQWMTATLLEDGRFHAVWHTGEDIVQIDPIEQHATDMHSSHYNTLATVAPHRMAAFRHSDLVNSDMSQCGAVDHVNGHTHMDAKSTGVEGKATHRQQQQQNNDKPAAAITKLLNIAQSYYKCI